jgi:hypothetical protein
MYFMRMIQELKYKYARVNSLSLGVIQCLKHKFGCRRTKLSKFIYQNCILSNSPLCSFNGDLGYLIIPPVEWNVS